MAYEHLNGGEPMRLSVRQEGLPYGERACAWIKLAGRNGIQGRGRESTALHAVMERDTDLGIVAAWYARPLAGPWPCVQCVNANACVREILLRQ